MDIIHGSKKYVDKCGERIYFKEPYFDKAMRRTFKSVEEKASFLNAHGIVQNGDSDAKVKRERREHEIQKQDMKCRMI